MTLKEKLYLPFKISEKEENILFWGCTHFNHDPKWDNPIYKQRGYSSAEECREGLIANWNKKANQNTQGFILGDIKFGAGGAEEFLAILDRLVFQNLYICSGNHSAGFHQTLNNYTDDDGNYIFQSGKKLIFCPNYFEAFVNGQPICFSHYPVLSFNGQAKHSWMLFSHVHGNLEKSEVGKAYLNSGARVYEVSVEKNPFPINFRELKSVMKQKEGASFDHHSKDTQNPF